MADRPASGSREFDGVLREVRGRFIATFPAEIARMRAMGVATAPEEQRRALRTAAHRLAGLSGTLGFVALGRAAAELEASLQTGEPIDEAGTQGLIGRLAEAFERDAAAPPQWADDPAPPHG